MNRNESGQGLGKTVKTSTWVAGLLLAILGAAGIILPGVMSLTLEIFLGWLMVTGGVFFGYYTFKNLGRSFIAWLKPLILIVAGVLLLANPVSGIAAIALLVSFYFFTDAFGSFGLAYERYPLSGWGWMVINGIMSLLLAVLILIGWPVTSAFYLGMYVGISLLFDGISLFMLGMAMK